MSNVNMLCQMLTHLSADKNPFLAGVYRLLFFNYWKTSVGSDSLLDVVDGVFVQKLIWGLTCVEQWMDLQCMVLMCAFGAQSMEISFSNSRDLLGLFMSSDCYSRSVGHCCYFNCLCTEHLNMYQPKNALIYCVNNIHRFFKNYIVWLHQLQFDICN